MLNSATQAAVTKIDVLFPECKGMMSYNELTQGAKAFIEKVEKAVKIPVTLIGTGPGALEMVDKRKLL
jgi:adenylosuccinate synthase